MPITSNLSFNFWLVLCSLLSWYSCSPKPHSCILAFFYCFFFSTDDLVYNLILLSFYFCFQIDLQLSGWKLSIFSNITISPILTWLSGGWSNIECTEMSRHAYLILQTMHHDGIYYSLQVVYILCKKWAVTCASAKKWKCILHVWDLQMWKIKV